MPNARKLRVFLIHAKEDNHMDRIRIIHKRLVDETWISPWFDEVELIVGQDWKYEILKALDEADLIIVCLSKYSVGRIGFIQKEIKVALELAERRPVGSIFIISLRLDDCDVPESLRKWQYLDYFAIEDEETYRKLMKGLDKCARSVGLTRILQVQVLTDLEPLQIGERFRYELPKLLGISEEDTVIHHKDESNMLTIELPEQAAQEFELHWRYESSRLSTLKLVDFRILNETSFNEHVDKKRSIPLRG